MPSKYRSVAGDEIEHMATGITYLAGESMVYPCHQMVAMLRRWEDM